MINLRQLSNNEIFCTWTIIIKFSIFQHSYFHKFSIYRIFTLLILDSVDMVFY